MDNTISDKILRAVASSNTQDSRHNAVLNLDGTDALTKTDQIPSVIDASGSQYTAQNATQLVDASRFKDTTDSIEMDWNYKVTTSKPFIVETGQWTTSSTAGTNLLTFIGPLDYFTGNHVLRTVANTFMSFRGDLHFVVSTQGMPLASGAMIVHSRYFTPDATSGATAVKMSDRYFRRHAILDISDNSATVDYVVPFKWYRNGMDPFDENFYIYIDVLVPLAGIGAVNYTVSCFLENQEFKFLRPLEENPTRSERVTQGLLNFNTINNTFQDVTNATLPMNMKGDKLDLKPSLMDDVGVPTNGSAMTITYPSLNNCDNPAPIAKMTMISSAQQVSDFSTFNTKEDEMDFKNITCNREHYIRTLNIGVATSVGQQIVNFPLTPAIAPFLTPDNVDIDLNVLEYYSQFFKHWRGGLKFKIRFFMNRFQSMKFYIGLFYKTITPTSIVDWSASHGVIVDVGGDQRIVEIEIPYNSELPWLNVAHSGIDITQPLQGYSVFDFIMGQLAIYAVTPLITPTGSPTSITAHVTMTTSDDFEFANFSTCGKYSQALMLSKPSLRTPDFITDTIVSVKQLLKRWQWVGTEEHVAPASTEYSSVLINPSALLARDLAGPSSTNIFYKPLDLLTGVRPYASYRGSLKVRIEMSYFTDESINFNPTPFCLFINPEMTGLTAVNGVSYITRLNESVFRYLSGAPSNFLNPPYVIEPINNNGLTRYIFEIEVPFQKNHKYALTYDSTTDFQLNFIDYGLIVCGFYHPLEPSFKDYKMTTKIYGKIGDDGRFGILQDGSIRTTQTPYRLWGNIP
jgi:hypothetical protein